MMRMLPSCVLAFCFSLIFTTLAAQGPQVVWAHVYSTAHSGATAEQVTDQNANVYHWGAFRGSMDVDPGPGTSVVSLPNTTTWGTFVSKIDSQGTLVWAILIDSTESFQLKSVSADANGNVVLAGYVVNSIDVDPGPGVTMLSGTNGGEDIFLMQLDANGQLGWAFTIDCLGQDYFYDMVTDPAGNAYLAASIRGRADVDPSPIDSFMVGTQGIGITYLLRYDAAGQFDWALNYSGTHLTGITVDGQGNPHIVGDCGSSTDLDPGPGTFTFNSPLLDRLAFVSKLTPNGTFTWATAVAGDSVVWASDVGVDPWGNVVMTGAFVGLVDLDSGPGTQYRSSQGSADAFWVRFRPNGSFVKAFALGSAGPDAPESYAMDREGNSYVGFYAGLIDFDPGPGTSNIPITSGGYTWVKYDTTGGFVMGQSLNAGLSANIQRLAIDHLDNLYFSGYLHGSIDADPTSNTQLLTSDAGGDMYQVKLRLGPCSALSVRFDSLSDVTCANSGRVLATAIHGTPPYAYTWNTTPPTLTAAAFLPTTAPYTVSVTDANGCTTQGTVALPGPSAPGAVDWSVSLSSTAVFPGLPSTILLDALNTGCIPSGGMLRLTLDPGTAYYSSNPSPSLIAGHVIYWSLPQSTYDNGSFRVTVQVIGDTLLSIGQQLCHEGLITSSLSDADTSNNRVAFCFPAMTSLDPNDKSVLPQGQCAEAYVPMGQPLTYRIRFQNTGTAPARRVIIVDSLDPALDLTSLRVIEASHAGMVTTVLPGHRVRFSFLNIVLPDSGANMAGSQGYVLFQIAPIGAMTAGTRVENRVGIYFDYNPPVFTNSVHNTFTSAPPSLAASISADTFALTAWPAGAAYQWLDCANGLAPIPGATGQTYLAPQMGYFAVQVSIGSCMEQTSCVWAGPLASPVQSSAWQRLRIFPNPSLDGRIQVDLSDHKGRADAQLLDLAGRVLWQGSLVSGAIHEVQLPPEQGLYLIRLHAAQGGFYSAKIVRQ